MSKKTVKKAIQKIVSVTKADAQKAKDLIVSRLPTDSDISVGLTKIDGEWAIAMRSVKKIAKKVYAALTENVAVKVVSEVIGKVVAQVKKAVSKKPVVKVKTVKKPVAKKTKKS